MLVEELICTVLTTYCFLISFPTFYLLSANSPHLCKELDPTQPQKQLDDQRRVGTAFAFLLHPSDGRPLGSPHRRAASSACHPFTCSPVHPFTRSPVHPRSPCQLCDARRVNGSMSTGSSSLLRRPVTCSAQSANP